jgi:hypothetical protein
MGNLQRELEASLTDPHRLGLHELEGGRITVFGSRARHSVQGVVQPLPFSGDLCFSRPQFRQAFHATAPWMFLFCSVALSCFDVQTCEAFSRSDGRGEMLER